MRVAIDCRPRGFSSNLRGFNDLRRRERGWAHDKKDSVRLVLIRVARMQHAGPVFRAARDSFPSGNRELFSGDVSHTLEGNHRITILL